MIARRVRAPARRVRFAEPSKPDQHGVMTRKSDEGVCVAQTPRRRHRRLGSDNAPDDSHESAKIGERPRPPPPTARRAASGGETSTASVRAVHVGALNRPPARADHSVSARRRGAQRHRV